MATSSIIETVEINNPRFLEDYVSAMKESAKSFYSRTEDEISGACEDPEIIKSIMNKVRERLGRQGRYS